jgi:hypothetical protein
MLASGGAYNKQGKEKYKIHYRLHVVSHTMIKLIKPYRSSICCLDKCFHPISLLNFIKEFNYKCVSRFQCLHME